MTYLFEMQKLLAIIFISQLLVKAGQSQTVCTYRVPVPDLDVCDASGGVEDNINAGLYEMKGHINGIQYFQMDNFKLLDQQINTVVGERDHIDSEVLDIGDAITVLKHTLESIQTAQANLQTNTTSVKSGHRRKKAVSSNSQLFQDLSAAKQSFQQSVTALEAKLQGLAKQVAKHEQQVLAAHKKYQTQLTQNQQDLVTTETQFTVIAQKAKQMGLFASVPSGAPVAGSAKLIQDVADLVVDGRTAEMVAQRQIDNIEKQMNILTTMERNIQSDIRTTTATLDYNSTINRIDNVTQQTLATTIAERQFGDLVGDFISNDTINIADAKVLLTNTSSTLTQVGQDVLSNTIAASRQSQEFGSVKRRADSLQSLITFTQGLAISQSTDLLNLRKILTDNIRVLSYAFGVGPKP